MVMRSIESAPQIYTRSAGLLYLAVIALGMFSEGFVSNKLFVPGDVSATAHNILASSALWNLGVAANLLVVVFAVPQLWIEYQLVRPVSKDLSLLFLLLNLVSLAVEAISKLFLLLVMPILSSTSYLKAFDPAQVHVLMSVALKSHDIAFNMALIFFGMACLVNGYLIAKSGYFPKLIGVMLQVAGMSYLLLCFAIFFVPALAKLLSPAIFTPILIGELSFCLWLLVKGVNVAKWREQLSRSALEQESRSASERG